MMSVESAGASEDLDCVVVDGLRSFFRSLWIDRGDTLFCSLKARVRRATRD